MVINHIDSLKNTISASVNPGISASLCGSNGLYDFPARIVIVFVVADSNSHNT